MGELPKSCLQVFAGSFFYLVFIICYIKNKYWFIRTNLLFLSYKLIKPFSEA